MRVQACLPPHNFAVSLLRFWAGADNEAIGRSVNARFGLNTSEKRSEAIAVASIPIKLSVQNVGSEGSGERAISIFLSRAIALSLSSQQILWYQHLDRF